MRETNQLIRIGEMLALGDLFRAEHVDASALIEHVRSAAERYFETPVSDDELAAVIEGYEDEREAMMERRR